MKIAMIHDRHLALVGAHAVPVSWPRELWTANWVKWRNNPVPCLKMPHPNCVQTLPVKSADRPSYSLLSVCSTRFAVIPDWQATGLCPKTVMVLSSGVHAASRSHAALGDTGR